MGESPLVRRRIFDVLFAVGYLAESIALARAVVEDFARSLDATFADVEKLRRLALSHCTFANWRS